MIKVLISSSLALMLSGAGLTFALPASGSSLGSPAQQKAATSHITLPIPITSLSSDRSPVSAIGPQTTGLTSRQAMLTSVSGIGLPQAAAGEPTLEEISFARSQEDDKPVDITSEFETGVTEVYAFFHFSNLKANDVIEGVWYTDDEEAMRQDSTVEKVFGSEVPETGTIWFAINNKNGLASGKWRLELSLNGELMTSGEFTILEEQAPAQATPGSEGVITETTEITATPEVLPTAEVTSTIETTSTEALNVQAGQISGSIGEITFSEENDNGEPVSPATQFPYDVEHVYAYYSFANLAPDDVITTQWTVEQSEVYSASYTLAEIFDEEEPPSEGNLWSGMNFKGAAVPGTYTLELMINGQKASSGKFSIESEDGLLNFSNLVITSRINSTGAKVQRPVKPTVRFAEGTTRAYLVFDYEGMKRSMVWGWRLSREGAPLYESGDLKWDGQETGSYAVTLPTTGKPGVYDVDLLLEDRWQRSATFMVGEPEPDTTRLLESTDFSEPPKGWNTGTFEDVVIGYLDGQYYINEDAEDSSGWAFSPKKFSDAVYEVDAVPLEDNDDNAFGFVMRVQDNKDYYAFMISSSGHYGVYHMQKGSLVFDQSWLKASPDTIHPGKQVNHLRLLADGPSMRFYANGRLLAVIQDSLWKSGWSGLMVSVGKNPPVKVGFDNWRVSSLAKK